MDYTYLESPIGELLLAGDGRALCAIELPRAGRRSEPRADWRADRGCLREVIEQLVQYFTGARRDFELELRPEGTPFQHAVWQALCEIPYGTTCSYGQIAGRIGRPGSARAVGAANGSNPIPIVIPCHRVIGSDGSLTGYGGGLEIKEWLLDHERAPRLF